MGKEFFELFLMKGDSVYGVLRNKIEVEKLKSNIPKNGKIILTHLSSDQLIDFTLTNVGPNPIDLLIDNAG